MVEEEFLKIDAEVKKSPHTFSLEFYEKMNRLLESVRTSAVHRASEHRTSKASQTSGRPQSFLKGLNRPQQSGEQPQRLSSFWRHRRYIAAAALLMAGISAAALANDDIRQSLQQQLKIEFFSDNVTIEPVPEDASESDSDAVRTFHAYKWKAEPEGYYVTFEEENAEFGYYILDYENKDGYLFEFMSDQPEEVIIDYINFSGVLEYGN